MEPKVENAKTVINLTDQPLTEDETSILAKGGNFSSTPSIVPVEEIIANVETAIQRLPVHQAEEIRGETAPILRKAHPPTHNITG